MSQYYLGFDAGTQSVKVAVYDENMNCIVSSSAPTTLTYPEPGWVSMDVDEYLALTIKGMKECASLMKEKGLDVTKIKSIMGDGIICGICGVDKDGNAITPYINYLDSRTKDDVDLVNSWDLDIFGKETGNPEANCMFPAMFARWFLKNIEGFKFVWFTDGKGWTSARKNLEETFDVLDSMYNINDVENGIMKELFK